MKKIIDISKGKIMVVSDLHGNWKDYEAVMRRWDAHFAAGEAEHLVILGDVVHARGMWEDASLSILDDLRGRGCNEKNGNIWCLLGNHEMVHIYHIELWKGQECYTSDMEEEMRGLREKYMRQLMRLPFMVRTSGGVLLIHAGACRNIGAKMTADYKVDWEYIRKWPHKKLLRRLADIAGVPEGENLLAELNPRIGMAFDELPQTRFLWEMVMNKNERAYGSTYFRYLKQFLKYFSKDWVRELTMLVSGHVRVPYGWEVVDQQQLRISSGYGAENDTFKTYLIIDSEQVYENAWDLEKCTHDVHPFFQ